MKKISYLLLILEVSVLAINYTTDIQPEDSPSDVIQAQDTQPEICANPERIKEELLETNNKKNEAERAAIRSAQKAASQEAKIQALEDKLIECNYPTE